MPRKSAVEYIGANRSTVRIQRDGDDVNVIANNRVQVTFTKDDRYHYVIESVPEKVDQVLKLIGLEPNDDRREDIADEIDLM